MLISLIAAVSQNGVIGRDGDLPWKLPRDMKFFMDTTHGHHVLMGRKNYDSIPKKYRPLPGRINLVVTRNKDFRHEGILVFTTIEDAVEHARQQGETELFIIGGGEVYRQSIALADRVYLTTVLAHIKGDTYFPTIAEGDWKKTLLLEQSQDAVHNFAFKTHLLERGR